LKNLAIVMAAGKGKRFKGKLPKQYVKLAGVEILARSIMGIEKEPSIGAVIVVAGKGYVDYVAKKIVARFGFKKVAAVIEGGRERYDSVYNALKYAERYSPENVVIHDGARPVFDGSALKAVLASLKKEVAAVPVTRITATVKKVRGGYVSSTVDRETLRASVTPQGYKYSVLKRLYTISAIRKYRPTDEAYLFEKAGYKVKVVEHEGPNIKVTTREDLSIAEAVLKRINN